MSNRLFISGLTVYYGDQPSDAPSNRVQELNGLSGDINLDFGGKYVWLVPTFTADTYAAASGFEIFIQRHANTSRSDLAAGAGGDFRYIGVINDHTATNKVVQVKLQRTDEGAALPEGWDGMTIDINKGRRKTFLYLMWKLAPI